MTEERRDRAYLTTDEVETVGEVTDTEIYEGETPEPDQQNIEMLSERDLRDGETADPNVAAEEGSDLGAADRPACRAADAEDLQDRAGLAAGLGVDAQTQPHSTTRFGNRIREALRADSATSRYADTIFIGTRDGTVLVRGVVEDLDDDGQCRRRRQPRHGRDRGRRRAGGRVTQRLTRRFARAHVRGWVSCRIEPVDVRFARGTTCAGVARTAGSGDVQRRSPAPR